MLLRYTFGGSWLPHSVVAAVFKLLTALFYASVIDLTPAREKLAA